MHSCESDGSLTPVELANACARAGLSGAALTDHDTLGGCAAFVNECDRLGVRGLAGVELSADFNPGSMHVLGYIPQASIASLQTRLLRVQESRFDRNREILAVLASLGFPVSEDEVIACAGTGMVGRPHIAAMMEQKGYVKDKQDAFRRYLAKGRLAYRDRVRFSPEDCIRIIHRHGGVAVLAHPVSLKLRPEALRLYIEELASYGLDGIEVFYPEHSEAMRRSYRRIAKSLDLIFTGGSDFHGSMNPAIRLGRGFGNVFVDDGIFAQITERMHARSEPAYALPLQAEVP